MSMTSYATNSLNENTEIPMDCENCPYKLALELLHPHLAKISDIAEILENGKETAMELLQAQVHEPQGCEGACQKPET